jgi:hypothetical protein
LIKQLRVGRQDSGVGLRRSGFALNSGGRLSVSLQTFQQLRQRTKISISLELTVVLKGVPLASRHSGHWVGNRKSFASPFTTPYYKRLKASGELGFSL